MTDQHRATPEQWASIERWGSAGPWDGYSCILELRARIEALEAAQQDKLDRLIAQDRTPTTKARPGGLAGRVAEAMGPQTQAAQEAGELPYSTARAAIREAAAAAKDLRFTTAKALIDWLDREADRG
jgi:hypothetical protein